MDCQEDSFELTLLNDETDVKRFDDFDFDSELLDSFLKVRSLLQVLSVLFSSRCLENDVYIVVTETFHFAGTNFATTEKSQSSTGKIKVKKIASGKIVKKSTASRGRRTADEIVADLPMQDAKLYAFPSFDRSDALIYFASTYSRLKNSGDNVTLSKLLLDRCAKGCSVELSHNANDSVTAARYLQLSDLTDILHPDSVCCMHSTKVVGNQIKSVIYFKFTDIPEMHDYAHLIVTDPLFRSFFVGKRKDILKKRFMLTDSNLLEGDKAKVNDLVEAGEEFQVYGHCEFNLTIDENTKKIVNMQYLVNMTSVAHNGEQYVL